ncbi:MAG: hypothetical protein IJ157_11105 [Clostridia bacterium]|nr:hypothetical protein [Clostridia bacterium]
MKKIVALALSVIMLLSLAATAFAAEKTYTLKIGVVITADDPLFAGLQEMKKEAEEKSGGRLKIDLYHSSQLGDTGEVVEQAVAGANVGTIAGAPFLEGYCKDFGMLMGPLCHEIL